MTCKDCIHYEVCEYVSYTSTSIEETCKVFKNKAEFIRIADIKAVKSEAIKEFWGELKPWGRHPSSKPFPDNPVLKQCPIWLEEDIDNLVKKNGR